MLETKIEKLTKAIEALTAVIEAQQPKNDVLLTSNEDFIKEIGEVQKTTRYYSRIQRYKGENSTPTTKHNPRRG